MGRFSERLSSGRPIVGDGGMGTLVSSAVARLRCPEEANLRAPESVLSAPPRLHPCGSRADRDEHLRRQPAQAAQPLPRGRGESDQRGWGEDRPRRPRGVGPRRVHRRIDRPTGRDRVATRRPSGALHRAGRAPRGTWRRSLPGRDVLRARRARDGDRRGPIRFVAPDRRAAHVRRRTRTPLAESARRARHRRSRSRTWPRSGRTTASVCKQRFERSSR